MNEEVTELGLKQIRAEIQKLINTLDCGFNDNRERQQAIIHLVSAKMWLGKDLGNNYGSEDLNAKRDAEELKNNQ